MPLNENNLIDVETLATSSRGSALIVDCRFSLSDPGQGERDFREAHVPGAVYASLDRDLSDLSKRGLGRHPLPDTLAFARTLSNWGWQRGQQVVAYDAAGGALAAARLWWMLKMVGVAACVLDGGWQAWRDADVPVASGAASLGAVEAVTLQCDASRVVGYPEVEAIRAQSSALLLDARGAPRFRGEVEPVDRVAGHVPGARNRPFAMNLDVGKRFKEPMTLRTEFEALLEQRAPDKVVHMCGSGVSACHNLLAMEVAGFAGSRLFVPSWSGWSGDPARPVATGHS